MKGALPSYGIYSYDKWAYHHTVQQFSVFHNFLWLEGHNKTRQQNSKLFLLAAPLQTLFS